MPPVAVSWLPGKEEKGHNTQKSIWVSSMTERLLNNRYLIRDEIGRGQVTIVYSARDTVLDRDVAVKVLRRELCTGTLPEYFHRSVRAMIELSHPYIINTYASHRQGDLHYLVQDLMPSNLRTLMPGHIRPKEAVKIGIQICEALKYAHRSAVVHGHLLPENILLDDEGTVRISDFGLAEAIRRQAGEAMPLSCLSSVYITPEQVRRDAPDEQSDIYSAGVILYELICARPPFRGETAVKISYEHIHEKPLSLRYASGMDDEDLDVLVMKALEKDPDRRFRHVDAMLRALRDVYVSGRSLLKTAAAARVPTSSTGYPSYAEDRGEEEGPMDNTTPRSALKRRRRPNPLGRFLLLAVLLIALLAMLGKLPLQIFPDEVSVPDIKGYSLADAERLLDETGLRIKVVSERYSNEYEAGEVISTEPAAGRKVRKQRLIFVVVSQGVETVTVPDLYNMTYQSAMRALKEMGFEAGKTEERYDTYIPKGLVSGQSPEPQTVVQKGARISLVISKGAEPEENGETAAGENEQSMVKKSAVVMYTVPSDGKRHRIRIVVRDAEGEKTYLDRYHQPGEQIKQDITGFNDVRVTVYADDRIAKEESF